LTGKDNVIIRLSIQEKKCKDPLGGSVDRFVLDRRACRKFMAEAKDRWPAALPRGHEWIIIGADAPDISATFYFAKHIFLHSCRVEIQ
jgi:hypothetical protein